ncbi:OsmC family protein [Parafrigoribacterium mesophilum]|uniref:OsmC family protein n=1 Tax=Parafrigoribacterium mesophilum TaxID=433646 RepID=UPI0031FC4B35
MNHEHRYVVRVQWQGNRGTGTSGYREYGREHTISAEGKPSIDGSADRTFHGNADRWNPEELLLAALSQCHMLSYLHVAVRHGIVVTDYSDAPIGTMEETGDGGGHFSSVVLRPVVTVASADDLAVAAACHHEASRLCFIANSVNFPVTHEPTVQLASE